MHLRSDVQFCRSNKVLNFLQNGSSNAELVNSDLTLIHISTLYRNNKQLDNLPWFNDSQSANQLTPQNTGCNPSQEPSRCVHHILNAQFENTNEISTFIISIHMWIHANVMEAVMKLVLKCTCISDHMAVQILRQLFSDASNTYMMSITYWALTSHINGYYED